MFEHLMFMNSSSIWSLKQVNTRVYTHAHTTISKASALSQVLGTLLIYVLFMVEELRRSPVENMDEVMYFVNGTYRLLEFVVALFVVAYGVCETLFGQWSVMGSTIILLHAYYNVWLRAQLGWQSFLLRRDAVHKIQSLPTASAQQLQQYNDICAICYQVCVYMHI